MMDEIKKKKIKTIAISEEAHAVLEDLRLELKIKKFETLLLKLANEYKEQRK